MIDKITEASLLYDFYGQLLTKRKQQVMELYYEENMSLAEIADEFGISRAAVHDSLKSAEKALTEYEEKLGLMTKFMMTSKVIDFIDNQIDEIAALHGDDKQLIEGLRKIKKIIEELD